MKFVDKWMDLEKIVLSGVIRLEVMLYIFFYFVVFRFVFLDF